MGHFEWFSNTVPMQSFTKIFWTKTGLFEECVQGSLLVFCCWKITEKVILRKKLKESNNYETFWVIFKQGMEIKNTRQYPTFFNVEANAIRITLNLFSNSVLMPTASEKNSKFWKAVLDIFPSAKRLSFNWRPSSSNLALISSSAALTLACLAAPLA